MKRQFLVWYVDCEFRFGAPRILYVQNEKGEGEYNFGTKSVLQHFVLTFFPLIVVAFTSRIHEKIYFIKIAPTEFKEHQRI